MIFRFPIIVTSYFISQKNYYRSRSTCIVHDSSCDSGTSWAPRSHTHTHTHTHDANVQSNLSIAMNDKIQCTCTSIKTFTIESCLVIPTKIPVITDRILVDMQGEYVIHPRRNWTLARSRWYHKVIVICPMSFSYLHIKSLDVHLNRFVDT